MVPKCPIDTSVQNGHKVPNGVTLPPHSKRPPCDTDLTVWSKLYTFEVMRHGDYVIFSLNQNDS